MKLLYSTLSFITLSAFLILGLVNHSQAAISIEGTRIIFPAAEKEITVKTKNNGKSPALMQIWLDRGNPQSQPQNADAPFLVTPPIYRLDAGKGQSVRLVFTGETLPQDRESLFWFNALEIPSLVKSDKSYMQVAVRSRLKLFYRPDNLSGDPVNAAQQVTWTILPAASGKGYVLHGVNPTPYHVTFSKLELLIGGKPYNLGTEMITPFSSQDIHLTNLSSKTTSAKLIYRAMTDYGVGVEKSVNVL